MIRPVSRQMLLGAATLALIASTSAVSGRGVHATSPLPTVTVSAVAINNSSAKISFLPVPGARDYRILDLSNPTTVKYAGMVHLDAGPAYHFVLQPDGTPVFPYQTQYNGKGSGPQTLNLPGTEIEWNLLEDRQPHTLEVQAVDQLGPAPPANLSDVSNNPLYPPAGMLGANEGPTPDGHISINGQGPYTDTPHVIAQSAPFVVQASAAVQTLPSRPDAVQTFFDTFEDSEAASLQQVGTANPRTGVMTYTLNAGTPKAWTIQYQKADTDHSFPMIEGGHFMDVLYDGITPSVYPGHPQNYHTEYASMSMSPQASADLSGGKLLHMTAEVDGHLLQSIRWLAWELAPANDPLTNFVADNSVTTGNAPAANTQPLNQSDRALWLQVFPAHCDAMLFQGPQSPTNNAPITNAFVPELTTGGIPPCYNQLHFGGNGLGLDNRDRFDIFLTTSHVALFEDGQMLVQADIPGGLPFTQAKLYWTHYVYATKDTFERQDILTQTPWETYWLNAFPYSDERHWDNMGFEVLPASAVPSDWSTLTSLIHVPASVAPVAANATSTPAAAATATPLAPTATSTAVPPTATSTPNPPTATPTALATNTPIATNTPMPSATSGAVSTVTIANTSASMGTVAPGNLEAFMTTVTAPTNMTNDRVVFLVYNGAGREVYHTADSPAPVVANTPTSFSGSWTVPFGLAPGTYTVKVGVLPLISNVPLAWDNTGASFTVQ